MKINEIFYSLQGEGLLTGLPSIFIRATGCNLRCTFCDTQYAYYDGKMMNMHEILHEIKKYPCKNICLTGGEPLLQHETLNLIKTLIKRHYNLCLETNGSQNIRDLVLIKPRDRLLVSLDVKCPSSKMHDKMDFKNLDYLTSYDQLKFIIGDKNDYDYAKKIINNYKLDSSIFMQPVWGTNAEELAKLILKDGLNVRLSLQMHKLIFGNKKET